MNLTNPTEIKKLLEKYNLRNKKFLGQNFLINESVITKSIEQAEISNDEHIIEVGPGLGPLTQKLAEKAAKVTAIELDKTLFPALNETLENYNNIEIIHADALTFIPPKTPYKVVANIPYNITSPLISHFLHNENPPKLMVLLIQKEVAEKICQKEPNNTVLSLLVNLYGTPQIIMKVSPGSFYPPPKVDSAVIKITPYKATSTNHIPAQQAEKILKLAKRAFTSGRKKLSNTLPELKERLTALNLNDKRPQHLPISDWQKLIE